MQENAKSVEVYCLVDINEDEMHEQLEHFGLKITVWHHKFASNIDCVLNYPNIKLVEVFNMGNVEELVSVLSRWRSSGKSNPIEMKFKDGFELENKTRLEEVKPKSVMFFPSLSVFSKESDLHPDFEANLQHFWHLEDPRKLFLSKLVNLKKLLLVVRVTKSNIDSIRHHILEPMKKLKKLKVVSFHTTGKIYSWSICDYLPPSVDRLYYYLGDKNYSLTVSPDLDKVMLIDGKIKLNLTLNQGIIFLRGTARYMSNSNPGNTLCGRGRLCRM